MEVIRRRLDNSNKYWARAKQIIPAGTQTLSKGPTQFVKGVAPIYLKKGRGCRVFDVDGNQYIDWTMALLPVILGYGYPGTNKAIEKQLQDGISFTLMHPLEVELSELLIDVIPCAEMVRFGKNGSDVTSAAVRLARAYTGKDKIACCGYHGWQDWYIATTSRNKGIPEAVKKLTFAFEYNKIDTLEKIFAENKDEVACVIMEPVGMLEPQGNFLKEVKDLTHKHKAILIFDEIVTGFRFSLGGAQEYFAVEPDMATFGKSMGNGMPISALVGKKEYMRKLEEVFFSFTFGGETLSLAASLATIHELIEKKVIDYLWKKGQKIKDGYNRIAAKYNMQEYTRCLGFAPVNYPVFTNPDGKASLELKSLFQQECIKRGVLFSGRHNTSFSHSDKDIAITLEVYDDAMRLLKEAVEKGNVEQMLEGEKVQPVFRSF